MRWIATPDIWLRSLVVIRVVVTTVLLGSGAIIYFENGLRNEAFFLVLIVASVYLLSLLYLLLTPFFYRHTDLFKGMQIGLDLILASAAIYITGGKSSPFIFLYGLVIIYSGMVLTRTASYIAAAASGVFYLLMELYRLSYDSNDLYISLSGIWGEKGVVYTYFNLSGFLLIAILIGYLADRVRITRKELGESAKNLQILRNLHENILQSLTSGVITLDLHGRIISINKTGLEIL
ncbi:MAG TPA: hypothetical protein VNK81_01875, partial [Thermodesulfobacteriota bacterium]|nr:hypothetical protein [Thermodesulfobacteriota bacterium]